MDGATLARTGCYRPQTAPEAEAEAEADAAAGVSRVGSQSHPPIPPSLHQALHETAGPPTCTTCEWLARSTKMGRHCSCGFWLVYLQQQCSLGDAAGEFVLLSGLRYKRGALPATAIAAGRAQQNSQPK